MSVFENYAEISAIVDNNRQACKKAGITADIIDRLDRYYLITETVSRHKNGKQISIDAQEVDARHYLNICSSCLFFRDRIARCYTAAGYLPVRFTASNPYSSENETTVRRYQFNRRKGI